MFGHPFIIINKLFVIILVYELLEFLDTSSLLITGVIVFGDDGCQHLFRHNKHK